MGSDMQNLVFTLLIAAAVITSFVLAVVFIAVPVFRGIGTVIGALFKAIGWLITHVFDFVGGVLRDVIRFAGALIALLVFLPLVPLNIVIGRWSAAGHFAERVKGEVQIGALCVYRAVIRRPLRLLLLDGLLEGLEQRVPEAVHAAPGADKPNRRVGQFDGYTIIGSLRAGGSGAKLYIAQPLPEKRKQLRGREIPDRVVIKCFALTEGSSLPQIVRESRALECAKQMGLVVDHGMDAHRFFYVMPYHAGDHLGILARQMHGECGNGGLDRKRLSRVMSFSRDLIATLSHYHKGGLWHKDVKPENVIVHDGRAHLVDLGLVTPLKSAMTLTTHGTEYFRDPEMVRQALRGVKVHQVDGAKFDIYAAGAVLYFMIENTFPAHGGLSRFVLPSPEALRWIVRRAMTEYHQRYETADLMLADLLHVMNASDPFAVKPAELPSMNGEGASVAAEEEEGEVVSVAHASRPPAQAAENGNQAKSGLSGFGFAAGIGPNGPFARAGQFKVGDDGSVAAEGPGPSARPRLKVTNWWTGEYRVEESEPAAFAAAVDAAGSSERAAREFRRQAYAFQDEAATISQEARLGLKSARRAAREQIRSARTRAREIRRRALAHRRQVVPHTRTSVSALVIGALSVVFLLGILAASFFANSGSSRASAAGRPLMLVLEAPESPTSRIKQSVDRRIAEYRKRGYTVVAPDARDPRIVKLVNDWRSNPNSEADAALERYMAEENVFGVLHLQANSDRTSVNAYMIHSTAPDAKARRRPTRPAIEVPPAPRSPYLLVNDHPVSADPLVLARIHEILNAYRSQGWTVESNVDAEVKVRGYLPSGQIDPKIPLPPMLHAALEESRYGGVLRIEALPGDGPAHLRTGVTLISLDPCELDAAKAEAQGAQAEAIAEKFESKSRGG